MCVVAKLYQQAEDSRSFDLDAFPHSEELDLHMSDDATSAVVVALQCLGGERGHVLSHAGSSLRLKSGLHTDGETWLIMPDPWACTFAIMCLGQEEGLLVPHFDGEVYLKPNWCELSPLQWYVEKQWDGFTISCYSKSSWMYRSHACDRGVLAESFPRSWKTVAVLD